MPFVNETVGGQLALVLFPQVLEFSGDAVLEFVASARRRSRRRRWECAGYPFSLV